MSITDMTPNNELKRAEEWRKEIAMFANLKWTPQTIDENIRRIQANALRYGAQLASKRSGYYDRIGNKGATYNMACEDISDTIHDAATQLESKSNERGEV